MGVIKAASNIRELLGSSDTEVFIPDDDIDTSIPPFDLGEVTKVNEEKNIHAGDSDEFLEDILEGKFEFPSDNVDVGSYFLPIDTGIPEGINLEQVGQISSERETHILDGDATGGGHGAGRGISGKREFPERWTDEVALDNITKVVKDPNSKWTQQSGSPGAKFTKKGQPVRWRVDGTIDNVDVRVIVEPDGQGVVTAIPVSIPPNP